MSEFVEEDWKLKAHAVVKLRRENTNTLVSLSQVFSLKKKDKANYVNVFLKGAVPRKLQIQKENTY